MSVSVSLVTRSFQLAAQAHAQAHAGQAIQNHIKAPGTVLGDVAKSYPALTTADKEQHDWCLDMVLNNVGYSVIVPGNEVRHWIALVCVRHSDRDPWQWSQCGPVRHRDVVSYPLDI